MTRTPAGGVRQCSLCSLLNMSPLVAPGLVDLASGATLRSPLIISILWAFYNMIPPLLVVWYAWMSTGKSLQWLCRFVARMVSPPWDDPREWNCMLLLLHVLLARNCPPVRLHSCHADHIILCAVALRRIAMPLSFLTMTLALAFMWFLCAPSSHPCARHLSDCEAHHCQLGRACKGLPAYVHMHIE